MAVITPVAAGTDGFVDPIRGVYTGTVGPDEGILTEGVRKFDRQNYTTEIYYFSAVADDDTWASGIAGLQAVFFAVSEGQDVADATSAHIDNDANDIRFKVEGAATSTGWLLALIDSGASNRSGYTGR